MNYRMHRRAPPRDTAERLLGVARKLFSEKGFERASVRAITRAAGANLGAVTYHFGSKDQLRDAVLTRLAAGLAQRLQAAAALPLPAPARLARIVAEVFAFAADNPDGPPLIARWILHAGRVPAPVAAQQRVVLDAVMRVVREGSAAGELRPVDPFFAAFSLLSQCFWFHLIRGPIAQVSGLPLDRPETAAAVQSHITAILTRALAPEAPSP